MGAIANNLQAVIRRVSAAASMAGRSPDEIELLAVSKTWPETAVLEAITAGQHAFGENYVQEGVAKVLALRASGYNKLRWHFIGPVQNNKSRLVAEHFDWVHSVDRLKLAERLSAQRPLDLPALQVCIQVNISGEASKSGCSPADLPALATAVSKLPRLHLRGLMAIPEPESDFSRQCVPFRQLQLLFNQLNSTGLALDTLSMGMSHDLEAAVSSGATLVRIGTAIFGERNTP